MLFSKRCSTFAAILKNYNKNMTNNIIKKSSLSGDFQVRHLFAAQELADIVNNNPERLGEIEWGRQTGWYNLEVLEDFFRQIESEDKLDFLTKFIVNDWQLQVDAKCPQTVLYSPEKKAYVPIVPDFPTLLDGIRVRVLQSREIERQRQELLQRWNADYCTTGGSKFNEEASTTAPDTTTASDNTFIPQYHLADLTETSRNLLNITDDKVYSEFVDILKNEIRPWIAKMRNGNGCVKKWNAVKFVCVLRGIIKRGLAGVKTWVGFLNEVFKMDGTTTIEADSVSQYSEANDKNNYEKYDSLPNYNVLKSDGSAIETMLKPVIDKMAS